MSRRRSLILPFVALVAAVALFTGACSSDKKADDTKKSTTTEKTSKQDPASTTTISDQEFSAQIETANKALDAAGEDPCKVLSSITSTLGRGGEPTNAKQREEFARLIIRGYRVIAATAPKDLASDAATLDAGLDKLEKEGTQTNWSEDFLKEPKSIDEKTQKAMTSLMSSIQKSCTPATGSLPSGATPSTAGAPTP